MRHPTFLEGVLVALLAAIGGSVLFSALATVFSEHAVLRLLIAGLGLAYVLYLLSRSREPVGRILTLTIWFLAAGIAWLATPTLGLYVMLHAAFIWLVRSLYFYSGVLPAVIDLGLNGLALAAGIWAAVRSDSLFLMLWCFFLVQALYVAIPTDLSRRRVEVNALAPRGGRFHRAHRVAEAALRRLVGID